MADRRDGAADRRVGATTALVVPTMGESPTTVTVSATEATPSVMFRRGEAGCQDDTLTDDGAEALQREPDGVGAR